MIQVDPWVTLTFAAAIFFIGLGGLFFKRNILIVLMCVELMLNAVNLTFVVFSKLHQNLDGQIAVLFIIVVAAAEAAVGLGLLIAMFRTLRSVDSDDLRMLKE
jgi:NADH-quinone oxidoreductase subunit K